MRPAPSCHVQRPLSQFMEITTPAGQYREPGQVPFADARALRVPGTLFGALAARGALDLENPPDLDSQDVWLRARLPERLAAAPHRLRLEGLAGVADVWIGGKHRLRSENMFRGYELALADDEPGAELTLRFGALARHLAQKRPRPRFRTRIVEAQQLRFLRTSLLGRTPGFAPRVPVLGPYREIVLTAEPLLRVESHALSARVEAGRARLSLSLGVELADAPRRPGSAVLVLAGPAGNGRFPLAVRADGARVTWHGEFPIDDAQLWWPHTHGAQPLSRVSVELPELGHEGAPVTLDFGRVGFRELMVERGQDGAGFSLRVNGVPIYCRGASWLADDPIALSERALGETLALVRSAGMNMLRVPGIALYESDAFYDACDELGLLVFQDFMFANMDYPIGDEPFAAEVRAEVTHQLARFAGRPAIAVLCGGSEVEQQAAMLGLPPALGQSPLFYRLLPELVEAGLAGVPYVPNSPCGGALPFQVDAGIAHYYGVGAYLRPLSDARLSGVRFAAECLAFANVPRRDAVEALLGELEMPFHHPRWKARVPRDRGAGWDFEDVRDHYLEQLYGENARTLRYADPERYLLLSRAVVVDVMEATLADLRRARSGCAGSLIWWLKDLWLGAGWGVLDVRSVPKSAFYALRRAFAPRALLFTDEGMNGPALHVFNDRPEALSATLSLSLLRADGAVVAKAERELTVSAHSVQELRVDAMFERFVDAGYVYRFGPQHHDLLAAQLRDGEGALVARAATVSGATATRTSDLGLSAAYMEREGVLGLSLRCQRFARRVEIDLDQPELSPEDNYFQLEPNVDYWVALRPTPGMAEPGRASGGSVRALNAAQSVRFAAPEVRS